MCLSVRLLTMNLAKASIQLSKQGNILSAHLRMGNHTMEHGMRELVEKLRM